MKRIVFVYFFFVLKLLVIQSFHGLNIKTHYIMNRINNEKIMTTSHINRYMNQKYQKNTLQVLKLNSLKSEEPMDMTNTWISSTLLVAGTTVGAGILALPAVAFPSGFIPSTIALLFCWIIMCSSGIIIAELSCNLAQTKGISISKEEIPSNDIVGIISITKSIFGEQSWITYFTNANYVLTHYILLVAYISQAGKIINETIFTTMDSWVGCSLYVTILASILTFGSDIFIANFNNTLFALLLILFGFLVSIGLPYIQPSNLTHQNIEVVWQAIPIMLLALVYHNVVPSICRDLKFNRRNIISSISLGSFIPLIMFLLWDVTILGTATSINLENFNPNQFLAELTISSHSFISPYLSSIISLFSMSAITTSFIGFVISLNDYYQELFIKTKTYDINNIWIMVLILLLPLLVASTDSSIFLQALDYSGTYGIPIIFGIIPIIAVYSLRQSSNPSYQRFLPGRDVTLICLFIGLLGSIGLKIFLDFD